MEKMYICSTKSKELERALAVWGIKLPQFVYEFFITEGEHLLCEAIENNFLLPLHALEARFHLPLHSFSCSLLNDYCIAAGQLSGFF